MYEELSNLRIENDLSDPGQVIWDSIKSFYDVDSAAKHVDKDILKSKIENAHPKHYDLLAGVIDSLPEDVSSSNLREVIIAQKMDTNSTALSNALIQNQHNKVTELWEEREILLAGELNKSSEGVVVCPDLSELFSKRTAANRIPFTPRQLCDSLEGGALPGHHILIYGVTDIGKTLTVLDNIRLWISIGKKVLYVCNEDPLSDLVERCLVSITGRDKWQIRKHYVKAEELAQKHGWSNLMFAPLSPGSPSEIEALVNKHHPDIVVVDQVRNLKTGDTDLVRRLENAAIFMRNLAKRHNILSVSVSQGADSARNKAILDTGDVDNSNVGLPGTTDLMLGVGGTEEMVMNGLRCYSFAKNKISGNKNPVQVFFNTKIMRAE